MKPSTLWLFGLATLNLEDVLTVDLVADVAFWLVERELYGALLRYGST